MDHKYQTVKSRVALFAKGDEEMIKTIKRIAILSLALLMCIGMVPNSLVYAAEDDSIEFIYDTNIATTSEEVEQLKNLLGDVEKYIDYDGDKVFNEESARENNERQEVIEIGLVYNEMLKAEQQGKFEDNNRKKRAVIQGLTHYGNWCGKGNNGKKPIDILDAQCKIHDKCYVSKGQWNSSCDVQFVYNIARNFGAINKLGWRARTYSVAAMVLFAEKVGGTGALKAKYPILAPFIP